MDSEGPMKIVLIGASVRSLIASCLQARCVPVAFDFFADWDAERLIQDSGYAGASLTKIDRYESLLDLDFSKLGDAAILAGGAELRLELVKVVSEQLPLLGPNAESLAAINDPMHWLQVLQTSGYQVPETRRKLTVDARPSDWLVKRSGTCGGSGVRFVDSDLKDFKFESASDHFFQKRITGQSWSTVLVSQRRAKDESIATFSLGCTRQWLASDFADQFESCRLGVSRSPETLGHGLDVPEILATPTNLKSLAAPPDQNRSFVYRGSIGPLPFDKSMQLKIDRIANLLAERFSMQGAWGMDFILDKDGQVWPVDFNPRITASAELFESTIARSGNTFRSVVDLHLTACNAARTSDKNEFINLTDERTAVSNAEVCEAKRIVFFEGPDAVVIDDTKWKQLELLHAPCFFQSSQTGATIADVPRLGDRIEAGRPLLTIRSRAGSEGEARVLLDQLFHDVQACIGSIC